MINYVIAEGGSLELDEKYLTLARHIKSKRNDLPFEVSSNSLIFNDYIVGELALDDISVKLKPRNLAFNLNTYFQIICYLYDVDSSAITSTGFSVDTDSFSFSRLSQNFCLICNKLLQFGLTGTYATTEELTLKINGDINFSNFYPQKIPYEGIPVLNTEFTIDTAQNRLIKAALHKLCTIENNSQNPQKFQILRDLSSVRNYQFDKEEALSLLDGFYSPNPWYLNAIDLSIKILFDLDLEYSNGSIQWMSFLENTNTIFESYVRKVLSNELKESVIKWDNPRPFLTLRNNHQTGEKQFSPDILINFDENSGKADAVIDVKNKLFEPTLSSSLDKISSTGDIYQLIFYCTQLGAGVGGLVYPSSTTNDPIELMMDSKYGLKLFLFSINMNEQISTRNQRLAAQVNRYLMRET